jgi:hypothetical protein
MAWYFVKHKDSFNFYVRVYMFLILISVELPEFLVSNLEACNTSDLPGAIQGYYIVGQFL